MGQRLGKAALGDDIADPAQRIDRPVLQSQYPVQPQGELHPEARRQIGARPLGQIADPVQPRPFQRLVGLCVHRQRGDRQLRLRAFLQAMPGQRQRRIGGSGQSPAGVITRGIKPVLGILRQPFLITVEMRRAGDIEDQRMRRLDRDHWRVALAGLGQPRQQVGVGQRLMVEGEQVGHPRPRVGELHARAQTERHGLPVRRHDHHRAADFLGQYEGMVRRPVCPDDPFGRQPGQGQRQYPARLAARGRLDRHGSTPVGRSARKDRCDGAAD